MNKNNIRKITGCYTRGYFLEDLSTSRVLYTNRAFRELFGISSDVLELQHKI